MVRSEAVDEKTTKKAEPGPMKRDSVATRRRLLDAAQREFAENGLSGARIGVIAAEGQANKQLIYRYFESKEGLYKAAFADLAQSAQAMTERQRASSEAGSFTEDFVSGRTLSDETQRLWIRFLAWEGLTHTASSPEVIEARQGSLRATREWIEANQAAGTVPAGYPAKMLQALMHAANVLPHAMPQFFALMMGTETVSDEILREWRAFVGDFVLRDRGAAADAAAPDETGESA